MRNFVNIVMVVCLAVLLRCADSEYLPWAMAVGALVLLGANIDAVLPGFRKVRAALSGFGAIHAALLFLFIAVPVWRLRPAHSLYTDPLDQAALYKIACMSVAGILAFISLVSNLGKGRTAISPVPVLVLIYALLALLSTLLGGNAYYGIYKSVELFIDTVFLFAAALSMSSAADGKKTGDFLLLLYFLLLVTEAVAAAVNPQAGFFVYDKGAIGRIFAGSFPLMDPNALGFISAIIALVSANRLMNARDPGSGRLYALILMFSLAALVLAQSRTSIFGLLAGLVLIIVLSRRWKVLAIMTAAALAGLVIFSDYFLSYIMRGQSIEMFERVSGRTLMWTYAWNKFLQSPVLGYGFASAGFLMKVYAPGQTTPVFNSYLECLVNSGLIGFIPWISAIAATYFLLLRGSLRQALSPDDALARGLSIENLGIMTVLLTRSLTTSMLTVHSLEFILFLALITGSQAALRRSAVVRGSADQAAAYVHDPARA